MFSGLCLIGSVTVCCPIGVRISDVSHRVTLLSSVSSSALCLGCRLNKLVGKSSQPEFKVEFLAEVVRIYSSESLPKLC
jgi:hypothetical protein